jgi:C-terminal processing protease CtpA/Prc
LGLPVYLVNSHPEERYYWRQFLADSNTLYVQYRQCADDPKLKFADFAAQTLAEIDARKTRRVIVDLRFNGGGNSRVLSPLTAALASRIKTIGAPLVLIGPHTFSSGVIAAWELHDRAKARLIGTPTGGLLGGYGESPSRKLPHSQLGIQWTITHFPRPEPVRPDITVITTAADLQAGRDPVLAAAIADPK